MPGRTPQNEDLERFLKSFDRSSVIARAVAAGCGTAAHVALLLDTYLGECYVALELVRPHLDREARILEIGSGIGVFAMFLRADGYDVTALEPVGEAFEFVGLVGRVLAAELGSEAVALDIPVESLAADVHGRFDLVFSVNVSSTSHPQRKGLTPSVPWWRQAACRSTRARITPCPTSRMLVCRSYRLDRRRRLAGGREAWPEPRSGNR